MNAQDFDALYIGRNALNVKSDLEILYPNYLIQLITPNTFVTMDYRTNRIRITHDNNTVLSVKIG